MRDTKIVLSIFKGCVIHSYGHAVQTSKTRHELYSTHATVATYLILISSHILISLKLKRNQNSHKQTEGFISQVGNETGG